MKQNSQRTIQYIGENNILSNNIDTKLKYTEERKNKSDLEKIMDELDSKKDKINQNKKIDEKLNFDNFFEIFLEKTEKLYQIPKKGNQMDNIVNNNLIGPYLNDELIDENYYDLFSVTQNYTHSLMFKKNGIREREIIKIFGENENIRNYDHNNIVTLKPCCRQYCGNFLKKGSEEKEIDHIKHILLIISVIFTCFALYFFQEFSSIKRDLDIDNLNFEYTLILYTKEYLCLSFDILDLKNENFKFNITCPNETLFYYVSKFGISPDNEEGENIANCYSKSFRNLIKTKSDCDFGKKMDEVLVDFKYSNEVFEVDHKNLDFFESLISCSNINNKNKIFLSYSCYYPYLNRDDKIISRKKFINKIIICESICIILCFLTLFIFRIFFYRNMKKVNNISIKDLTIMIDNLDIKKTSLPSVLNSIISQINSKSENYLLHYIQEINYSFINSEEKELYEELNNLIIKNRYLEKNLSNRTYPRCCLFKVLFKVLFCFKKTYKEEYINNQKKLKRILNKILIEKDSSDNIKKIYITFSSYEYKEIVKQNSILIDDKIYVLKNADMHPHDINWENININSKERIKRRFLSYLIIIIFIIVYFIIIIFLSKAKNKFEKKFNLNTDCSNVDYKNNYILYQEYINKDQTDKEKIFTYCYCASELNGKIINYNNENFDPCSSYNKYKFNRTFFLYFLSVIETILGFFIDKIVKKIISIQKFESKSKNDNAILIISMIILIFEKLFSIILIYAKFSDSKNTPYFFDGIYEDITPDWINSVSAQIISSALISTCLIFFNEWKKTICCGKVYLIIRYLSLFLINEPISSFHEFYKIYAPLEDKSFIIFVVYIFFVSNILIVSSSNNFYYLMLLTGILFMNIFKDKFYNFKNSYSFIKNRVYYRIIFTMMNIIFISRIIFGIWWYSSEYFFIDLNKDNIYQELISKKYNKYIDVFLKGEANTRQKIIIKLLLKRNIWFYIAFGIIIISEVIYFILSRKLKKEKKYYTTSLKRHDTYRQIKLYQYYRILYYKINKIYFNESKEYKYLKYFIKTKMNWYKEEIKKILEIFGDSLNQNDDDNEKIIKLKESIINYNYSINDSKEYERYPDIFKIKNNDQIYSPFILEDYEVPFNLKFIFSPYYS